MCIYLKERGRREGGREIWRREGGREGDMEEGGRETWRREGGREIWRREVGNIHEDGVGLSFGEVTAHDGLVDCG